MAGYSTDTATSVKHSVRHFSHGELLPAHYRLITVLSTDRHSRAAVCVYIYDSATVIGRCERNTGHTDIRQLAFLSR